MQYLSEEFDSKLLERNVSKLTIVAGDKEDDVSRTLQQVQRGAVYAFVPFTYSWTRYIAENNFYLITIRSTYKFRHHAHTHHVELPVGLTLHTLGDGGIPSEIKGIQNVRDGLAHESRYRKDPQIGIEMAQKIYGVWLENTFFHGYADEYFALTDGNTLAGFVSLKVKDRKGYIDLLGVSPAYQNRQIGSYLIVKAISYFKANGIEDIFVITEGENIRANRVYQKNGFVSWDICLVYHKHFM
jgi:ribosomal protein S18 acetylase RimI-like enzyme